MDGLRFNKIAAGVLGTALAIVGLRELSSAVYGFHPAEKPGYAIEVVEETAGGGAAELPPDWGTVLPAANLQAGEAVHQKCVSCHTFNPGGANGTGPNIYELVGRKPGTHGGFAYSQAMVDYGNAHPAWTYEELDAFIKSPQKHINGTKMTFVGVKKQEDRINLIAFLRTLSASPAPIPAPNPAAAAAPAAEGAPAAGAAAADQPVAAPPGTPAGADPGGGPVGGAAATNPTSAAPSMANKPGSATQGRQAPPGGH
jgi:cytochrome c